MSGTRSVADALVAAETVRRATEQVELENEGLPPNDPRRLRNELDLAIVRANGSVFNEDIEVAMGVARQMEDEGPGYWSTEEENQNVQDELEAAVRSSVERESLFGMNRNAVNFEDYREQIERSGAARKKLRNHGGKYERGGY